MSDLANRLREVVRRAGGGTAVAKGTETPLSTLNTWLAGTAEPKASKLKAIADFCSVSADWLLYGETSFGGAADVSDFALIPRHEVRASAGAGLVPVTDGEVADLIAFRRDWLRGMGINPDRTALIEAAGDSMEPSIPDGAIMLLDTSITEVRNGWIYAIVRDGELLVKRIQKTLDGKILLISDNDHYRVEEIAEDRLYQFHIAGRVMWVGRAL